MSTSAISSSLLAQIASSPSTANQFVTDLNQLAQDLQSGNLAAAQQDYVTLSEDALNGATSTTATTSTSGITDGVLSDITSSSSSLTSFVNELNQLGSDVRNGDLGDAQSDMLSMDSTALNAASAASESMGSTAGSSTQPANQGEIKELVDAITAAMEAGDDSVIGTELSELASLSPSAAGASILEQESESYGGSSSSTSPSSISQLVQEMDSGPGSLSTMSLMA